MNVQVLKTYTQQGLYRAVDIFNHQHEYSNITRVLGFRFLLQWGHIEKSYRAVPDKLTIISQMKEMVQKNSMGHTMKDNSTLMELVDMLVDFSPEDGKELLAQLRECGGVANNNGPTDNGPECTVYGDSQSVHNKTISETVRRAAKYLCVNYTRSFANGKERKAHEDRVKQDLIQRFSKNEKEVTEVLERIYIDNANFGIECSVDQVLFAILNWAEKEQERTARLPPHKRIKMSMVLDRLGEELLEMHNYCSSGLLSRLINSLQGLTDVPELQIKISNKEQVKSVLYSHFDKAIQNCGDEDVIDGLSEGGEKFLMFIKTEMENNIERWYEDYGDEFLAYVTEVANDYTNVRMYG
jgi:hypothetical protein